MTSLLQTSFIDSTILHITLNRPEALNVLNKQLMQELLEAFNQAKNNFTVKAVLISGVGKAFCAGADIKQLATLNVESGLEFARYGQLVFRTIEQLGKPTLAAVHGFAFGGGCELAMAATLRIAATATKFAQPEVKLGVIPGFGGTQRLARLIGKGRALDLCLTGRSISASEAQAFGLVSEVVPEEELLSRGTAILQSLVTLAPLAMKSIMTVIDQGYDLTLNDALELEASHFGICCATQDKAEGVQAFLEKRAAVFTGE